MGRLYKKNVSGKYGKRTIAHHSLSFDPVDIKERGRIRVSRDITVGRDSVKIRYAEGKGTRTLVLPKSVIYDSANEALLASSIRIAK